MTINCERREKIAILSREKTANFSRAEIANPCREGVASPGLDVGFKCRSFGWGQRPETLRMTARKPSQDSGRGSSRP